MSQIIESKKIADILTYVDQKTLVIFDVDGTLIEPVQEFGSSAWFVYLVEKFKAKGINESQAVEKTYAVFEPIRDSISFKTVEPDTIHVIKRLSDKNIKTMAMTMRWLPIAQRTADQLKSVNISIENNTIYNQKIIVDPLSGFSGGILYAGSQRSKGECLITFLGKINHIPEHVLFIDDSQEHVDSVFEALNEKNIPCICIRYGATDEQVATFDPVRAAKELEAELGSKRYKSIFEELL